MNDGNGLADALRDAAAGRGLTPEAVLSFDRAAFLDEAGEVKRDELVRWVEDNSSPVANPRPTGDADLGARVSSSPVDPRAADLAQIERDLWEGRGRPYRPR